MASGFTSGTTSGTSGSMRNLDVLSITTQPAAPAFGANSAETLAPGENRPISTPLKSKVARSCTFTVSSSPNETVLPAERSDAGAMTSSTGMLKSERHTSELQSLMRNSYAVFCLKKKSEDRKQKGIKKILTHVNIRYTINHLITYKKHNHIES